MNNIKHYALSIIKYILVAFLLIYHCFKLYSFLFGKDFMNSEDFLNSFSKKSTAELIVIIQNILRVLIISGLYLVARGKKIGIFGMWIGISLLVLSQFWLVNTSTNEIVYKMFSGLKPLKGLFLPTIITVLYISTKNKKEDGYN